MGIFTWFLNSRRQRRLKRAEREELFRRVQEATQTMNVELEKVTRTIALDPRKDERLLREINEARAQAGLRPLSA